MRVFIGTVNVADNPVLLRNGFRALGMEADMSVIAPNKFYLAHDNDVDVSTICASAKFTARDDGYVTPIPPARFFSFAERYDIFVFIASSSLLPRLTDLALLSAMGKTVICYQTGSEWRHECTSERFWRAYGHEFPLAHYPEEPKGEDGKRPPWWKLSLGSHTFANKLHNTRLAEAFATTICTTPSINSMGIRPYMAIQVPFDASGCTFHIPKRQVPLVVHAPSMRAFKRSDLITAALLELKEEGVPFEFLFLENVPNATVLEALTNADVLVDEICCDGIARLDMEGMSSGCAVLTGNSGATPWTPDRPVIPITPATVKERLREVLTSQRLRLELASAGKEYMRQGWFEPETAAKSILQSVQRERAGRFDYYPTAFADFAEAPADEPTPPYLHDLTVDVLRRHGVHPETDLPRMERAGLLPPGAADEDFPRWDMEKMRKIGPWNWCRKDMPEPLFDPDRDTWTEEV